MLPVAALLSNIVFSSPEELLMFIKNAIKDAFVPRSGQSRWMAILLLSIVFGFSDIASALTATEADAAFAAYNKTFLIQNGNKTYYKQKVDAPGKTYFWMQASEIQLAEDAYLRTNKPAQRKLVNDLLTTFIAQNGKEWKWNQYNDDLGWADIAFVRGYEIIGDPAFLKASISAWNLAYNRGWDDAFGGGVWWDVKRTEKDALSNNPNIVTGCHLYKITRQEDYLIKSEAMYAWIRSKLYVNETGAIYEKFKADGTLVKSINVYNMGTFINAANCLYKITGKRSYYDDALRTALYVKSKNKILSHTNYRHESAWQEQFARGLGEFVRDNHLWSTFYPWMVANADAAWNSRRPDLDISWNDWLHPTPQDNCDSFECLSAAVMLQWVPPTQPSR
jgi:predicted alpha-1,6-mannanase (GH76 family)